MMSGEPGPAMSVCEFVEWAEAQPIHFELVAGRPVRLPEAGQRGPRLRTAIAIAIAVLGCPATAGAWMATPMPAFGGRHPASLVAEGDEGMQGVLRHLIREARHGGGADRG